MSAGCAAADAGPALLLKFQQGFNRESLKFKRVTRTGVADAGLALLFPPGLGTYSTRVAVDAAPPARGARRGARRSSPSSSPPPYCDAKVANHEIRVWHLVIENGY